MYFLEMYLQYLALINDGPAISTNGIIWKNLFSFRGPDGGKSMNELNEFTSLFRAGSGPYCVLGFMLHFILRMSSINVPLNTGDSHVVAIRGDSWA